jgi:hypothetical protein
VTVSGKTELAKALAEFLFDDANAMVRIDMSEYMVRRICRIAQNSVASRSGFALTFFFSFFSSSGKTLRQSSDRRSSGIRWI